MYNNYPYTDFHSLNLDYLLKKYREVDSKVETLELVNSDDTPAKLLLKDSDNNVISSIDLAYAANAGNASTADNATNATHATSADAAQTAANATKASKDVNDKNLTSYIADVTYSNNIMTFKDGVDNNVEQFTIEPSSSISVNVVGYYKSGETDLCDDNFNVGDSAVILTEYDEISDLNALITNIINGSFGSFSIFRDSTMDFIKQIAYSSFVTLNYANAPAELCVYVIYAQPDANPPHYKNIKWRLFYLDVNSSKVDGKVAFTLTRID